MYMRPRVATVALGRNLSLSNGKRNNEPKHQQCSRKLPEKGEARGSNKENEEMINAWEPVDDAI